MIWRPCVWAISIGVLLRVGLCVLSICIDGTLRHICLSYRETLKGQFSAISIGVLLRVGLCFLSICIDGTHVCLLPGNFEEAILGYLNETLSKIMYTRNSQLDEICLFVHAKLWISLAFLWWIKTDAFSLMFFFTNILPVNYYIHTSSAVQTIPRRPTHRESSVSQYSPTPAQTLLETRQQTFRKL